MVSLAGGSAFPWRKMMKEKVLWKEGFLAFICCRILGNQGKISVKNRTLA
jgi:hypothetical protein